MIPPLFPPKLISAKGAEDRDEQIKTFLLIGYLFCVVSASTIGRTTADTLFLSRFGPSQLSFMYLPQAASLILMGFGYQRLTSRFRVDHLLPLLILLVSGLALASRFLVSLGSDWVFQGIYVGYDVLNYLMIVCFWQLATAVLDQRKAKKTIVWIGSGGIIGSIVSGFALKPLVLQIGTENLIYFYAGLQLVCLFLVLVLPGYTGHQLPPQAR
jgi:ATP/ADP translocase